MLSVNPAERLAAALLIPGVLAKRLRLLDDFQLARLLDDEVGAQLNLLAPESTICLAAADRLREQVNGSSERKRFGIRRRARGSWVAERDEGTHILNAEVALYRGAPLSPTPVADESVRQQHILGDERRGGKSVLASGRLTRNAPISHGAH